MTIEEKLTILSAKVVIVSRETPLWSFNNQSDFLEGMTHQKYSYLFESEMQNEAKDEDS